MPKKASLTSEEILDIVQSAIKQSSHPYPSPMTIERFDSITKKIEDIEEMLRNHANEESSILRSIQESVAEIIRDQDSKHSIIERQLLELKPFNDGINAAKLLDKAVKYIFAFVIGLSGIIAAYRQFFK